MLHAMFQALPGSYRAASWPEDSVDVFATGKRQARPESMPRSVDSEPSHQPRAWRQRLPGIITGLEQGLQAILSDVLLLLTDKVRHVDEPGTGGGANQGPEASIQGSLVARRLCCSSISAASLLHC